jgi:hypothetical protein
MIATNTRYTIIIHAEDEVSLSTLIDILINKFKNINLNIEYYKSQEDIKNILQFDDKRYLKSPPYNDKSILPRPLYFKKFLNTIIKSPNSYELTFIAKDNKGDIISENIYKDNEQ